MEGVIENIKVDNLSHSYDDLTVFHNFSVGFSAGKITCILGPSGCGKTTLLNIVGGLIKPTGGTVNGLNGQVLSYIFQEPRLLAWKTVRENVEFVLPQTLSTQEREQLTQRFIDLVELTPFANYYPSQLSGGMRQRVSIARAFAYPSTLILMDEPLKGLDIKLKRNLIKAFAHTWRQDRRTVLFVTHDVEEALLLGHEILVLSKSPVEVITRLSIEELLIERHLNSPKFIELKENLLDALHE